MKNVQTPHRQGPRLDLNFKYEIEMDEERHSLHYRPQARVKCKDLGWNIQFGTGHATTEGLWFNNLFFQFTCWSVLGQDVGPDASTEE